MFRRAWSDLFCFACCYHSIVLSGRTFGTPTLGCREDRLDESSTNARCNGNGKRAEKWKRKFLSCQCPDGAFSAKLTLQTPQATVHSSLVALAWLAWHSMHRSMMWLRQIAQLSTTISGSNNKMWNEYTGWRNLEDPVAGSLSGLWVISRFLTISLTPSPKSNCVPL